MHRISGQFKVLATSFALAFAGCGGGGSVVMPVTKAVNASLDTVSGLTEPVQEYATKVVSCATGDVPETALQGQVPAALRAASFKGFHCNMEAVGNLRGEGGNWSTATFTDSAGHRCAYHSTAIPGPTRLNPGVPVIDITDPTKPVRTMSLTTAAMVDPWNRYELTRSVKCFTPLLVPKKEEWAGAGQKSIFMICRQIAARRNCCHQPP